MTNEIARSMKIPREHQKMNTRFGVRYNRKKRLLCKVLKEVSLDK